MVQCAERASYAAAAVAALVALAIAPTGAITTNAPSVDGGWFRGCVWSPPGLSLCASPKERTVRLWLSVENARSFNLVAVNLLDGW